MIKLSSKLNINNELQNKFNDYFDGYKPEFSESIASQKLLSEISQYGKVLSDKNSQLCIVGVGGSSLGSRALYEALGAGDGSKEIIFFDNVDSYSTQQKMNKVKKEDCHWLFVSKSGGTVEVLNLINLITQQYGVFKAEEKCTVITDNQSSLLFDWGKKNKVKMFYIPLNIGGRFSVFTPVGLLPLSFMGKNLNDVVLGYEWALKQSQLLAKICVECVESFSRKEWTHLYWIYSDSLQGFGLWLQQLWMESLGKKLDLNNNEAPRVSSLFTARGISDQHSILQQVSEGRKDKLVIFVGDQRSTSFGEHINSSNFKTKGELTGFSLGKLCSIQMQSTYEALAAGGVSTNSLYLEEVSTKSISALMSLYMMVTVAIADHLNINPFDQPGVESSKERTKAVLDGLNE